MRTDPKLGTNIPLTFDLAYDTPESPESTKMDVQF